MSAAVSSSVDSQAPEIVTSRSVRLVRVIALLVSGLAITFTATLHERLAFDTGIAGVMIAWVGVAHLIEWFARRRTAPSTLPLILGVIALLSAIALPFLHTAIGFGLLVVGWALASSVLEFVGAVTRPGSRQDAILVGAAGMILALLALIFRGDQVAVLGLLGAYGILTGVFLAISVFDTRRGDSPTGSDDPSPADAAETTAS